MNLDRLHPAKTEEQQAIRTLKENERDHILRTLVRLKGKISGHGGAAQQLDVPPSTLNSKINKLAITKEDILTH
jgi:formate hydrogenlyase transcriptional activator